MNFTFVNKNLLIPQVEIYSDFNSPIQKLLNMTYNMDSLYCSNLYIVSVNCIYFSKNNYLYSVSETNIIKKIDINIPNNSFLKSINSFLNLNTSNQKLDDLNSEMNINFHIHKQPNIIIQEELINNNKELKQEKELNTIIKDNLEVASVIKENKIESKVETKLETKLEAKTQEELEIIKLCEETMEIYQNEVRNMKDIEKKLKILDNNKKDLLKKRKEKLFTNFSKLKNDYNTIKKINVKLEKNPKMIIPLLFELKYNYFVQFVKEPNNVIILEQIENSNLDEVLNKDCELDEEIVKIVNIYSEESKDLNVKFEHSWEDLEYETESIENNNSKLSRY